MTTSAILADLGEFRVINEVVLPRMKSVSAGITGSDCGYFALGTKVLAITTDYGPRPLAWNLGLQSFESWGWYAVLINISDLAAAGANDFAFVSSIDAPSSFRLKDLDSFFEGIANACAAMHVSSCGGNLREAKLFACHGTAIGNVNARPPLTRAGARPGDSLYVVGPVGKFIRTYLRAQAHGLEAIGDDDLETLLHPLPQSTAMKGLSDTGMLTSASDNSDGLLGAIWNILERSGTSASLILDLGDADQELIQVSEELNRSLWNMFFFWGDWNVAITVRGGQEANFHDYCYKNAISATKLGLIEPGPPKIVGCVGGSNGVMKVLRNENFSDSSFNNDAQDHLSRLLNEPLFTP